MIKSLTLLLLILFTSTVFAGHLVHGYTRKNGTYVAPHYSKGRSDSTYSGVQRDSKGKIQRSESAKYNFKKSHPCPSTGSSTGACSGYVVDHVIPLCAGGTDSPSNMQWQTIKDAKAKDAVE